MLGVRLYHTRCGIELGMQIAFDVAMVPCPDCDGHGDFELPDGSWEGCIRCKNQGVELISAFSL